MRGLDKKKIVETALDLLERDGFGALSLRKVADALGVQTPALYWHVRNRAELHGLMAEAMFREALDAIDPALVGGDYLVALGRAQHATWMRRRDSARLIGLAPPTEPVRGEFLDRIFNRLMAGGLDSRRAIQAHSALQSFTLGWTLFQGNQTVDALMHELMDVDEGFEAGLAAIAAGFCGGVDRTTGSGSE